MAIKFFLPAHIMSTLEVSFLVNHKLIELLVIVIPVCRIFVNA